MFDPRRIALALTDRPFVASAFLGLAIAVANAEESPTVPITDSTQFDSQTQEKSAIDLDKVTVTAPQRALGRKASESVARMPLKNLENPQAYSVVPNELTQEQIATDYKSAFKNIPGAGTANHAINGRSLFTSRGFSTANYVRNGMISWTNSDVDPANLESVEAIRGPSAVLFGGTVISYGGLFNRVTKRPYDAFGGEISYAGGLWNLSRYTADVNLPLNAEKTALLRVNAASHEENSFQDAGYSKSLLFAPTFAYKANDRLSFLLEAEWYDREAGGATNGISPYGFSVSSMDETGLDPRRAYTDNSLKGEFPTLNVSAQAEYKLAPGWTSRTQYALSRFTNDYNAITLVNVVSDEWARRRYMETRWTRHSQQVQQNVTGDFQIGPVRNRLLIGLDFYAMNDWSTERLGWLDSVNLHSRDSRHLNATAFQASQRAEAFSPWSGSSEVYTYGAYISNILQPMEALTLHLGLRWDRFDNRGWLDYATGEVDGLYEQDAFSPKAGVVYEVLKDALSLFANYQNGFRNVNGKSFSGETFELEQANQWEVGLKLEAAEGKVDGMVSYYDIAVDDIVRPDPNNRGYSLQDGKQKSQGLEIEVSSRPIEGLSLLAGYAWNDSRLEKAAAAYTGRRPEYSGAEHAANFWSSYRLTHGPARGLGLGVGANYFGEQYLINEAEQQFTVPEYVTVDATVFYEQPRYRIGVKIDNVSDEVYWNGWGSPQPPRRFISQVSCKF